MDSFARDPAMKDTQSSLERTFVSGHPAIRAHVQISVDDHKERAESSRSQWAKLSGK